MFSVISVVIGVSVAAGLLLPIVHMARLKYNHDWPAFSQWSVVEWLGGTPWLSSTVLAVLAVAAFRGLMRVGIRVKATSEAHL